jgi:cytochrome P450
MEPSPFRAPESMTPPSPTGNGLCLDGGRPGVIRRLANLRALIDLPRLLARVHANGTAAVRLDAGPYPLAYLRRPETVKAVLDGKVDSVAERGRFFEDISRVIGTHSLVTCQGDEHHQLRRLLSPAFRPEQVAHYAAAMVTTSGELMAGFEDKQELAFGETMSRLTLEIAARALLGLARAEQLDDFAAVLSTGTKLFYRLMLPRWCGDALWRSRLSPANRRLRAAQSKVDRFVQALLAERRAQRDRAQPPTPAVGAAGVRPTNLLDVLLGAEEGSDLDGEVIRDQIVTFLFAGHETTAQALTWVFVLLDRNPAARVRLEAELDGLRGAPQPEDLPALRMTRAVVREALRLYPPAWFLARETLDATVIDGCPVPKGTLLLASPLVLQRDASLFPDPLRFDPDRWLTDDGDAVVPDAYLPFGHGPRNCIGANFALTELVIVVATLARVWHLHVLEPERVRERPTVTLRPRRPVRVVLERRTPIER